MNERDEAPITCCPPGKCAVEEAGSGPACPRKVGFHARASAAPQEPVAWIDEFGNVFPLAAYKPPGIRPHDDYKTKWRRLYAAPQPQAAPQEPEPDPSDELAWYKWAHKELGRRNTKLAEENFQYWQKERDAAPQPQDAKPTALQIVHEQAEDEGLWFEAQTAPEAYLQQELRRLHGAVEASQDAKPTAQTADARDAERWRWIEPHFRVFSPHIDGNHHYCATGQIGRITGPTFGSAVDAAIRALRTTSEK
jgi:hypothetical protein